jgi:hypothetical protein
MRSHGARDREPRGAARPASPDHDYYLTVRARRGHQRAVLSVARKLTRRCHHTLRALGEEALAAA